MLYWLLGTRNRKAQNLLLLAASYIFYGLWDWRFLLLLFGSSILDYVLGLALQGGAGPKKRKFYLYTSVFWNIGILFVFKYFNFFIDSFSGFWGTGPNPSFNIWTVVIPVGLSFYTFQTLSYTIDVYRGRQKPTKNIIEFLCYVSFFPQLVAGPIERARTLLPQFENKRSFNVQQSKNGLRLILWGLVKKVLVADKLGVGVAMVYNNPENYGSIMLFVTAWMFSFQLYCDFSGYVDIARGTAKLFGFELSRNFVRPYFSNSANQFWTRWHVTLTKWFTDYLYVPMMRSWGASKKKLRFLGLLITMLVIGLWHGANWTFVVFGGIHGFFMIVERIPFGKQKKTLNNFLLKLPLFFGMCYFLTILYISCVFFRAEDVQQGWLITKRIFSFIPDAHLTTLIGWELSYAFIVILIDYITIKKEFPLQYLQKYIARPLRWALYYLFIFMIIRYAEMKEPFIYFQF